MCEDVAIVDYTMGNLGSVQNAVNHVGGKARLVSAPSDLSSFTKVILPGVGAFRQGIECLKNTGLALALEESKARGAHILGICLGMQLMCSISEEDGVHEGLSWFPARVVPFVPKPETPVPHMGWNNVDFKSEDPVLNGLPSGFDAYFLHGYHVQCENSSDVLATANYALEFHSIIRRENFWGIQFHPEKSQEFGLKIIKNFIEMPC